MPQMVQCDDELWHLMQRSCDPQANLFCAYLGGVHIEHDMDIAREWVTMLLTGVASSVLESKSRDVASPAAATHLALSNSPAPPSPVPPPYASLPALDPVPNPIFHPQVVEVEAAPAVAISPPPVLQDFHIVAARQHQKILWTYRYGACSFAVLR